MCRRLDFAQVDLGVEVRGKRIAVITGVDIHDIDRLDRVQELLGNVRAEDVHHARVRPGAEKRRQPGGRKVGSEVPLRSVPVGVIGIRVKPIGRFGHRGIDVVRAGLHTGVHDRHVPAGERHVEHHVRAGIDDGVTNRGFV